MDFENLHQILRNLYTDMLPLSANIAGVAKGLAGLGALFYIAHRVWQSLSRAEPIDVYPLLRPFVIGLCIMLFPTVILGTMNSILSPIVQGTNQMLETQTFDMHRYRQQKQFLEREAMMRNPQTAWLVDEEAFNQQLSELGILNFPAKLGMYSERAGFRFRQNVQRWFHDLLEIIFKAAALIIDTLRTFFLIVLAILGPIAFAISVYDGFQSTLTQWISRYVSIYLWLPVSDLFSTILARIQVLMLQNDIYNLQHNPNHSIDGSNVVYIIFMLIGIVGYITIPTVASWVISAGGVGNYNRNLQNAGTKASAAIGAGAGAISGNLIGRMRKRESS